ncbi:SDR family oxidoreductase [Micrococcus cohnii]|uniref:Uncharacterized protein YbjT (DUF2867 family) n=1 Tax=Micrococcus cohnii TaxID=993416 RepID=A0A7W7M3Z5_9MICC|nr:SDR family oxidoreductase [Micrococcus cohnii]MBB4736114.1 uncharacterized protein YbjT (DUF2867 family) [Micrococcus cohnii]
MSRILLIGGHGKVALQAAPLLTEAGHEVTSVIRNPEHTHDVEATGATALVLDVEHADETRLAEAMTGMDAVVFSAGAGAGSAPERTRAVDHDAAIASMRAAADAGVRRYVMVSYLGASLKHGVPADDPFHTYAQAKAEADEHLRGTDLDWTILGPALLTDAEPTGRVTVDPTPAEQGGPAAETSRGNVARAIVTALAEPATVRRQIEFVDGQTPLAQAFGGSR